MGSTPEIAVRREASSTTAREALPELLVADKEIHQQTIVNRFQQVAWLLPAKDLVKEC